ncbi:ABC transporter permease [Azospirillum sp. RWY-5-1]|uniref:ABC transporter permease n=1 Tax=Azospirillum oleiclasticum TaxID=2735135 RepID=A0ABX2TM30_9PROT|nr:ABC transporter permease [Azospirillum oleiclasticum]NYZ14559.1 ABC transporter permease [Azospirillum oleiclasticum]NYZ24337.1 ABC transporter permease [Azospirillum oleiclasticum]
MTSIARAVLYRTAHVLGLLLAVLVFNFLLIHLAPGDPAQVIAGDMGGATPEVLAEIRTRFGLDLPLHEQLLAYLGRVLTGDLGYSFYFDRPVTALIGQRILPTLILVLSALVLAVVVGTVLGVISARWPRSWFSHALTVLSLAGYSAPVFWTGILLLILFASVWPLFPVTGMYSGIGDRTGISYLIDVAHHLVLPAFTLAIVYIAQYSRLSRAAMLDVLGSDYIRTARAKGLGEGKVIFKHALRNAILPVITMAGLQFSNLFAGAVLVETVFGWPGMGRLAFESILRRDAPTILGILFFSALVVIVANQLTDLFYRLADPRIAGKGSR